MSILDDMKEAVAIAQRRPAFDLAQIDVSQDISDELATLATHDSEESPDSLMGVPLVVNPLFGPREYRLRFRGET